MNVLVTGATGNVGTALIRQLALAESDVAIFAAVRDVAKAGALFAEIPQVQCRRFDYDAPDTFDAAIAGMDIVFLLRPPHISEIAKVYPPLFDALERARIRKVVLLSVQGAPLSTAIPHRKIELLILKYRLEYIFVRPSYFMQNLTTTLLATINQYGAVVLPAGRAKFNWIDIENIAQLCAVYLCHFDKYASAAYDVTGNENLDFEHVVARINQITGAQLRYRSVSPLWFVLFQLKNGVKLGMAVVMCILHYLPRFQKEPKLSGAYRDVFGREPDSLDAFIAANRGTFLNG